MTFAKVTTPLALSLIMLSGCGDGREPSSTGLLTEPVSCLDQKKICAGMEATMIDRWIADGGAVEIESAACGNDPARKVSFAAVDEILKWCATEPHIAIKGRTVDYSFVVSSGKIASITIQRRGTFP